MFRFLVSSAGSRHRQPEIVWLEPEQLEQVLIDPSLTSSAHSLAEEADQWQLYLNILALTGFEQWLQKRTSTHLIDRTKCINQAGALYNVKVAQFKLSLIAREHVLDEVVEIPRVAIEQSDLAAHFYVLIEVSEEQQRVIIRGFVRYDRLLHYCNRINEGRQNGYCPIPLSAFDPEPNHLLFYCDFLEPALILLPMTAAEPVATPEVLSETTLRTGMVVQETPIRLGQWVRGIFTSGWQAIADLVRPEVSLAWSPRNQGEGAKRGKLIDLGIELQGQKTVLLVSVTEEADKKLSVLVQLHPVAEERHLPPQIALTLFSQTGEKLQEVCSRTYDNYIQLKPFKGRSGVLFSIAVSLGNICIRENFEL